MDFKDLDFVKKCEVVASFLNKLGKDVKAEDWPLKFRLEEANFPIFRNMIYYIEINDKNIPPIFREMYIISSFKSGIECFKSQRINGSDRLTDETELFRKSTNEIVNKYNTQSNEF